MFEIFVFINPIGIHCYDIEKIIQETIAELDLDVSYHIIPSASHRIIKEDIHRRRCANNMLRSFSFYTRIANRALADYHAIKILYGNKKARKFLMKVQARLENDATENEADITNSIIQELNMKSDQIDSLRNSEYVKESIAHDNKIFNEWNINKTPTTVIFDNNDISRNGILIENTISKESLIKLLKASNSTQFDISTENFEENQINHLRVL